MSLNPVRDGEAEALVGDGIFRVAAVDLIAGEARDRDTGSPARTGRTRTSPQVHPSQGTPTRWPMAKRSTPWPSAVTVPMISCPGTSGSLGSVSSPSTTCRSVRQTAQACTRICTCPGPGVGIATAASRSGRWGVSSSMARKGASSGSETHLSPVSAPLGAGENPCATVSLVSHRHRGVCVRGSPAGLPGSAIDHIEDTGIVCRIQAPPGSAGVA